MNYRILYAFCFLFLWNCKNESHKNSANKINPSGEKLTERISPPSGFKWVTEKEGSFGEFLTNLTLKEHGSLVLDYTETPIQNQKGHCAIINVEIGNKDLQQCADAVIRLYSDYLWEQNRFDEIGFHFTSGHFYSWEDYKNGIRPQVTNNNQVTFIHSAAEEGSLEGYRKYLDIIFMYAGTISLTKETTQIKRDQDIETGSMIIIPGSPGHVVFVVGRAENAKGEIIYLLAQGYTPAQSIHVLNNPNSEFDPWYSFSVSDESIQTSRYKFSEVNIRKYS